MNLESIRTDISRKDFELEYYVQAVIADAKVRERVVELTLNDKDIMVYYHGFYILDKAAGIRPELFIKYWSDFVNLLRHKNSYHRDIALTIIANLIKADKENNFSHIARQYFSLVYDKKFMTACVCIRNLNKIVRARRDYLGEVVDLLLEHEDKSAFSEKQEALLNSDILVFFDDFYGDFRPAVTLNAFILHATGSLSPKTRKIAKGLVEKYDLLR